MARNQGVFVYSSCSFFFASFGLMKRKDFRVIAL